MSCVRNPNAARAKDPRLATKKADPSTPQILRMWADGIPVEIIAEDVGKSLQAVRLVAAYHKVKRPAWYIKVVRGSTHALSQARKG
jgi:hypothetical protein